MSRFRVSGPHRLRVAVIVGGLLLVLTQPGSVAVRVSAQGNGNGNGNGSGSGSGSGSDGKPDPCARLFDVPGNANGLHKECAELGGGSGVARGDFNGDTIGDLAIGVPYDNVGSATDAGSVHVIYGSVNGLTATGNQFFTQDSPGVPDTAEDDDHFGLSVAAVDLNHDGYSDLAVGIPTEDGTEGRVQMFMGSASGLAPGQAFTFLSVRGRTCGCLFGSALAWGDFDKDNLPDLAIGMRAYEVHNVGQGGVMVLFGDNSKTQVIEFPNFFYEGDAHASFGMELAAGDRDNDGYDDLAVGAPLEDVFRVNNFGGFDPHSYAGVVYLYAGHTSGLRQAGLITQDVVGGTAEYGDQFGKSLAFGDFDNDGRDDLAVGAPFEDIEYFGGSWEDAGAVSILYGDDHSRTFTQDNLSGVEAESLDQFGFSLAAGDFDLDGSADLAIGVPGEDIGNPYQFLTFFQDAGIVHVLYGAPNVGLQTTSGRNQVWHQDKSGVPGEVETGDRFGYSLSAWNFGNGTFKDLAIGVPFEDVNGKTDAGAVVVLYGQSAALSATNSQIWHKDSTGIADTAGGGDRFGNSMY